MSIFFRNYRTHNHTLNHKHRYSHNETILQNENRKTDTKYKQRLFGALPEAVAWRMRFHSTETHSCKHTHGSTFALSLYTQQRRTQKKPCEARICCLFWRSAWACKSIASRTIGVIMMSPAQERERQVERMSACRHHSQAGNMEGTGVGKGTH